MVCHAVGAELVLPQHSAPYITRLQSCSASVNHSTAITGARLQRLVEEQLPPAEVEGKLTWHLNHIMR